MEDLTASTYLDRMEEGLSRAKVENIVRYLAILHSYTYKMGEASSDWLAPFPELLSYYRIYENDFGGERMMEEMIQAALVSNPQAADSLRKLKKVITNKDFMKLACRTAATENGVPLVMVHGDLWTNNILWKMTEDGRELDEPAAFIDWQLTFAGG
jgi:thiamine kinase-like enzyme